MVVQDWTYSGVFIHNHTANVRFLKTRGHGTVDTGCEYDIIARFSED